MTHFMCFTMRAGGRIKEADGFESEAEADDFGRRTTAYRDLNPEWDKPDHYEKYDPPIVIVVETQDGYDVFESGKYTRPVAIFQRGEKWMCVKEAPQEKPL